MRDGLLTERARPVLTALVIVPALALVASDVSYVPGSSQKLEQFIGDTDFQTSQPTLSQTFTQSSLRNTDLGVPFRHKGQTYFLFGDSNFPGTGDAFAYTSDTDPESGLTLTFFNNGGVFAPIVIPGIFRGAFDVPIYGFSSGGKMYLYYATDSHASGPTMGRTVLAVSTNDGTSFSAPLYTLSSNLFINVSVIEVNCADWPGLPQTNGMGLLIFGSGPYRKSDIYLAFQPEGSIEDPAALRFFTGLDSNNNPMWTTQESNSVRVAAVAFTNGSGKTEGAGELSATFNVYLKKWILLYNLTAQIQFKTSDKPWGPFPMHGISFDPTDDQGYTNFIYLPDGNDLNLCQPNVTGHDTNTTGGVYGPYVFNSFSQGSVTLSSIQTTLYHTMSTWNPYNVVLMRTRFTRRPPPIIYAGSLITNVITTGSPGGADATCQSGTNANSNLGTSATLGIKNNGATLGNVTRKTWLRFPVNLPPTQRVAGASLTLTVGGTPGATVPFTYNVYGLRDSDASQNWNETTITWNNAPGNITNDGEAIDLPQAMFLGSFRTDTNRTLGTQIGFSSMMLNDFLNQNAKGSATFIVTRLTIDSGTEPFASHESTNPPPTLALVTLPNLLDQLIAINSSTAPLTFVVDSIAVNPSNLTVKASSSDTNLLPVSNIVLGGSGSNRTVTLTPAANAHGTATVTLFVSDGVATTNSMSFRLTVAPLPRLLPYAKSIGGFSFGVIGDTGPTYTIQSSGDLFVWTNLLVTNPLVMPFNFTDTNAINSVRRYYRAVLGP